MTTHNLNRDALVVGICQYGDLPMSKQLDTLAKQAEQFAQLLETQGGFRVRRLPCAADGLTLDLKGRVTLPELEQAIEKLLDPPKESPTQTALLFFAGHGLVKETRHGTEGFLATSEADGQKEYGISLQWLRERLRNSPVKQQIVFLEACHSGEFFTHFQIDKEHDYCFVTSARAHEEALADGLLTQELLDILDCTKQLEDSVTGDMLIKRLQKREPVLKGWQRFMCRTHGQKIVLSGSVRESWLKVVMVVIVAIIFLGDTLYGINKLPHNGGQDEIIVNPPELETLRRKAEKEDLQAQTELGVAYYRGEYGAATNYKEAFKWCEKAAKQGYAEAKFCLSAMYAKGDSVAKDETQSFQLLKEAAEKNNPFAQYDLAEVYDKGLLGVSKNKELAAEWYKKSADQFRTKPISNSFIRNITVLSLPSHIQARLDWLRKAVAESSKIPAQPQPVISTEPSSGLTQSPSPQEDLKKVAPLREKQVSGEPVAFIENINCTPDDFNLTRGNKQVPPAPYALLYPGDKITVLGKQSHIENNECFATLFLSKERLVRLTTSNSPYVVSSEGGDNTVTQVFDHKGWEEFESQFKGVWFFYNLFYIKGREEYMKMRIPLIRKEFQQLVEGKWELYLGWDSGKLPYEVQLSSIEDGRPIRAAIKIETNKDNQDVVIENFTFLTGHRYHITVSDAVGIQVDSSFEVVNGPPSPLLDREAKIIENSNLPPRVKTTLLAIWLVSKGGGKWNLEAYQRVVALLKEEEEDYYPAIWLKEGLKRGWGWGGDDKAMTR